jgi:nucleotide-binding universal stress UspA family protein
MKDQEPIVVAVALEGETTDVLAATRELALRMGRPIVPVHAVRSLAGEPASRVGRWIDQARAELEQHMFVLTESGVEVREAIVADAPADVLVNEVARAVGAHMIVTGGGAPPTVRRWLFGSVAEKIVRASTVPVFVFRGTMPGPERGVLCPVGDSHEARLGLAAAIRMARLFEARLHVLRVIEPEARGWIDAAALDRELERELATERADLDTFLATVDLDAVAHDKSVVIGKPAERIVEASENAALIVLGSRGFERFIPASVATLAEHAFRFARTSALCINDREVVDEAREADLRQVAELKRRAEHLLREGQAMRALALLQEAAGKAPADAAIQESFAAALNAVGRTEEAGARLGLARAIRASFR